MASPACRSVVARAVAAGLAALTLAGCADSVTEPVARAAAPAAAPSFSTELVPTFAAINGVTGFQEGFSHLSTDPAVNPLGLNKPMAPAPWGSAEWSVVRHVRDAAQWYKIEPMMAWHGTQCERPNDADPAKRLHHVEEYQDMVFLCRNHLMTAVNAGPKGGYGVVYLTPDRMVDLSAGTAVVRFDVATLRHSGRDWIDLWVTPYEDNLVTPLDDSLPDLQGEPRRGVHVRMRAERTRSAFTADVIREHRATRLPSLTTEGYEATFARMGTPPQVPSKAGVPLVWTPSDTTSATRRDTFELHISRTRVKFGMPRYNLWWVDAPIADLGWSRGVIQLGHHSFDPGKDGGSATSWHWDNVGIQPAQRFTILNADRRFVDTATPNGEVVFPRGAPAGAHLRFSGIGPTEVMFIGGATGEDDDDAATPQWASARRQMQERLNTRRFASYWMPVPPGTTRVRFRPVTSLLWLSGGQWMARDISVWSPTSGAPVAVPPRDDDDDGEG